jgi:hypothetical protein
MGNFQCFMIEFAYRYGCNRHMENYDGTRCGASGGALRPRTRHKGVTKRGKPISRAFMHSE